MVWERNIGERWDGDKYQYQMNNGKGEEGEVAWMLRTWKKLFSARHKPCGHGKSHCCVPHGVSMWYCRCTLVFVFKNSIFKQRHYCVTNEATS